MLPVASDSSIHLRVILRNENYSKNTFTASINSVIQIIAIKKINNVIYSLNAHYFFIESEIA